MGRILDLFFPVRDLVEYVEYRRRKKRRSIIKSIEVCDILKTEGSKSIGKMINVSDVDDKTYSHLGAPKSKYYQTQSKKEFIKSREKTAKKVTTLLQDGLYANF